MKWLGEGVLDHLRAVASEPDLDGTRYRLLRTIGRGGMGDVYAVEDTVLGREVALKVVGGVRDEVRERLRREARVLARLEHPGIVPVHDLGELPDGRTYYVMKLVQGERLDVWIDAHPELRGALRLFQRICEAVAFAHAHGVLHRDLKPENVMVGAFGEALVMDWGIAKLLAEREGVPEPGRSPPASRVETADGAVIGTPAYMAPEQARGDVDALDARSDVYGLGAVLYYLLCRRPPFSGDSVGELLRRVSDGRRDPLDADVPRPLASIVTKALATDPSARYENATELADDVGRWLDGLPVRAHRETPIERAGRFAVRHRVILSLLAAYVLLRAVLALFSS